MSLDLFQTCIRWIAGTLAYLTLGFFFFGIWRGIGRPAGRGTGHLNRFLRSPVFYLVSSALFLGGGYLAWIPLPWQAGSSVRIWTLVLGCLLYFPGISLVLWGGLALGKSYFTSTSVGAHLFKGHDLVTTGPYAIIRHPMYAGLLLAALGAVLLYTTWTTVLFAVITPFTALRAYREETVLAAEFGDRWREYCRQVPAFLPRMRR